MTAPDALGALVTPVVLTYDEAANLDRVLDRLRWADRVLVIDSGSTDGTLDIAARYANVEVLHRPFDSFAEQWNWSLAHVTTEWALSMDADYVPGPGFEGAAQQALTSGRADVWWVRFVYCIEGRPLRATLYPPRRALYRTAGARYAQDGHRQWLEHAGSEATLEGAFLYHDDRKPLGRWLAAQDAYARQELAKLTASGAVSGWKDRLRLRGYWAPLLTPLYCLVVRGLVFDGRAGFYYTAQRTYAELLLALRRDEARLRHAAPADPLASVDQSTRSD